jgi:hypothetical protein
LLSVLAFVYYSIAAPVKTAEQKATINCFINHLKQQGKLDATFPKYPTDSAADLSSCASIIARVKRDFLTLAFKPFDDLSQQENDCIHNDASFNDMVLDCMLMTVYSESGRTKKLGEVTRNASASMFKPMIKCMSDEFYAKGFDAFMSPPRRAYSEEKFYCMRKFVVENDLIDKHVYDIAVNPKNLDFADVNCDNLITTIVDETYQDLMGGLEENVTACIVKKHREAEFALKK